MSERSATGADRGVDEVQRPEFGGCMFCYAAAWALYAGRKAYRTISG